MADPDDRRLANLRRIAVDPRVAEDGVQHLTILVAALTGRITRQQAARAIGYTAADLNQAIANAGMAGEQMAREAITGGYVFVGLWAHHARQAEARRGPDRN
jgi:hypothetical protein